MKEFPESRTRKVRKPSKYRGKRCAAAGLFEHASRKGECTARTPACPEEGFCYVANWGEWTLCKGSCNKMMGARKREAEAIH